MTPEEQIAEAMRLITAAMNLLQQANRTVLDLQHALSALRGERDE